jgi:hypothetical protein
MSDRVDGDRGWWPLPQVPTLSQTTPFDAAMIRLEHI